MTATVPDQAVPRVAAADRGATRIADRVVGRIASQAAREVLRGLPTDHLVPRDRFPQASVSVRPAGGARGGGRGLAKIRLYVDLGYPADLRAVCAAVRRHVIDRVGELCDMTVREVSVEVEHLHSSAMTADHGRLS
ncbi:Asp23/Gls24 family envelope stress response protein [Streptomyces sp. SL13]|uniref:Asp23/Gls24 family envelope stress response protein n=1 Tax=Streptantibioticus silvisoli TaxID=2705255 RepID=A0AA90H8K8_9ACTN|nr:Asp23/Gls24 family envelope stress response protein [Streptantibioticus silvisoli]MDI5963094.1 Asp23/Gls24 family envelope stress response protein [Streptantibioticus silvisoli]MDI5973216.1 Asp23/Gls24 family envelope stress response protein [Streptantibioticus silvisoli]